MSTPNARQLAIRFAFRAWRANPCTLTAWRLKLSMEV